MGKQLTLSAFELCRSITRISTLLVSVLLLALTISNASAFEIDTGSDWKVRWDNTLKYSLGIRLPDQDRELIDDINTDDGDRNFDPGPSSNRLDVLSELDISYHNYGIRASAAGWIDSMYLMDNDNNSPATFNGTGRHDEFPDDTERLHGFNVELLDAFFFGKNNLGRFPVNYRIGRHTLMWGESLFFAQNSVAAGQAPIDNIKLLSVPSTPSKELFMPVNQASAQIQLLDNLSLAAFWQFEWRRNRIPASGSYFSDVDLIDAGGERILLGLNPPGGLGPAFFRGNDLGGGDTTSEFGEMDIGQWGISARFRSQKLDTDFGLYYYRYHDKAPQGVYIDPTRGEYFLAFQENIHMLGASFGTQIGPVNVSGEVSGRIDTPLLSESQIITPGTKADNDDHTLLAIGDTVHANLSCIYFLPPSKLWDGGTLLAEAGWQYVVDVTRNEDALDRDRDDWALGFRMMLEPAYYQIFPGVDLKVPIGLGYNPAGRSPVDIKFNGGADEGGDVSIGLNIDYQVVWKFGINYTNWFGSSDTATLKDRDLITLSVQRTF